MRVARIFILVFVLVSILLVSNLNTWVHGGEDHQETQQAIDYLNHRSGDHRAVLFEYSSQDPDIAYSLFMHHSSGGIVLVLGLLLVLDQLLISKRSVLKVLIGCTWMVLGAFVFINSDLEGWPIGSAGFIDSFRMPTASEWVQHKALSLIPMVMGAYVIFAGHIRPIFAWEYVAAGIALLGGIALQLHQHADHPGFDVVNLQHRIFALTAVLIASCLIIEQRKSITWRSKPFLMPLGIILLGFQLVLYVE